MTQTILPKVESILNLFNRSQVIVIGDSPYLHQIQTFEATGEPDNEVVRATWRDEEFEYEVKFTEAGLAEAKMTPNGLLEMPDHEGTETLVGFYSLQNDLANVCQNDLNEGKLQ